MQKRKEKMAKKVFISHASADEQVVSLFVDHILQAGCGVQAGDIVYTSREDTGVVNGDDIPSAIKDGIRECAVFIMMVSDNYRNSEVCLNEMGAAWMVENLPKKIVVLPGVGFEKIGWLMSLRKGTRITDERGLDALHDQICEILSLRPQTATWNDNRSRFIEGINKISIAHQEDLSASEPEEEDEAMDILDYREGFNYHTQEYTRILGVISGAMTHYNERIGEETGRMNLLHQNPAAVTPAHVREIMVSIAGETNLLAEVYEVNTPLLRDHFGQSMSCAIALQKSEIDNETIRQENREAYSSLMETMKETKNTISQMRDSMDGVPDLDKSFRKSKRRLQIALDKMLEAVDYCIKRANELQIA